MQNPGLVPKHDASQLLLAFFHLAYSNNIAFSREPEWHIFLLLKSKVDKQ